MRFLIAAVLVSTATLGMAQTAPKPIPAPPDVAKPPADAARTKSGLAPTNFISPAGHNLATNWKIGSRLNANSRLSRERIDSKPSGARNPRK